AKLAVHGSDRNVAIGRLRDALDRFYVTGVQNNVAFLAAVAAKPRFHEGALSTNFIAEEFPGGYAPPAGLVEADRIILLAAALAARRIRETELTIDGKLAGTHSGVPEQWTILLGSAPYQCSVRRQGDGYAVEINGESLVANTGWQPGQPLLRMCSDATLATVQIERLPGAEFRLTHGGVIRRVRVLSPSAAQLLALMPERKAADTSRLLLSPMPGLLSSVAVALGQEVKSGEVLAIVEAMKMENVLRADRDGRIAKIRAKPGDSLAVDEVILEFE
ncbi:MAG TPA: biotin/lipoyl-containing protein, partial [Stellaceae bacterium]|nr:biotin/lipoyl-containing protein [Stellaceae bacterium]